MTGDVVTVDGTNLLVKMQPGGELRFFNVPPGRQFMIDGQNKLVGDLKPGTHLTAMVITKTQPLTVRTMSTISGTVWHAQGNYVILTLSNGRAASSTSPSPTGSPSTGSPHRSPTCGRA